MHSLAIAAPNLPECSFNLVKVDVMRWHGRNGPERDMHRSFAGAQDDSFVVEGMVSGSLFQTDPLLLFASNPRFPQ